jgi:glycosyltransferase involved in cell wall biosynthesis
MDIQWLISTEGKRIHNVENILLFPENGLTYVVSHQSGNTASDEIPEKLIRPDVKVYRSEATCLSANRNNALRHATGEILVLGDDDIRLKPAYPKHVLRAFNKHPEIDVACFQIRTGEDEPSYKVYPKREKRLGNLRSLKKVSSIEITFRRKSIEKQHIRFDERFGLGTTADCGEEFLFLAECLRKGLKIRFFPVYIVEHPSESSVKKRPFFEDRRLFVTGAQNYVLYGDFAYLWNLLAVLRRMPSLIRSGVAIGHFLKMKNAGCRYIKYGRTEHLFS